MADLSNILPPGLSLSGTGLYDFILESLSVLDTSQPRWALVVNCVLLALLMLHFTVGWAVIALMVHRRGDTRWQNVIWMFKKQSHLAYDEPVSSGKGSRWKPGKTFWVPHVLFCLAAQAVLESVVLVTYLGVATSVYYSRATLAILGAQPFLYNIGNLIPYFGFTWAAVGTYYATNVSFTGNTATSSYGHRPPHPWIMNSLLLVLPVGCAIPTIVLSARFFDHIRRCVITLESLERTTTILRQASIDGQTAPPDALRQWTIAIADSQRCSDVGGAYTLIWRLQAAFYGVLLVVVPPLFYVSVRRLQKRIRELQSELQDESGGSTFALPLDDMKRSVVSEDIVTESLEALGRKAGDQIDCDDSLSNVTQSISHARSHDAYSSEMELNVNPTALKELQLARLRISRTTVLSQAIYTVACSVSTFAMCVWSTMVLDQLIDSKHTRFLVGTLPFAFYIVFSIFHNITLAIRLWRLNPRRLMHRASTSSPQLSSAASMFAANRFSQGLPSWLGFDTRRELQLDARSVDRQEDVQLPQGIQVTIMTHTKTEVRTAAELAVEREVEQRLRKRRPRTKGEAEVGRQRQEEWEKVQVLLFGVDSESPEWPSTSMSRGEQEPRKSSTLHRFGSLREK